MYVLHTEQCNLSQPASQYDRNSYVIMVHQRPLCGHSSSVRAEHWTASHQVTRRGQGWRTTIDATETTITMTRAIELGVAVRVAASQLMSSQSSTNGSRSDSATCTPLWSILRRSGDAPPSSDVAFPRSGGARPSPSKSSGTEFGRFDW